VRAPVRHGIGDYTHFVFNERVGMSTPCGECSRRISDLNLMTVESVLESLDKIVKDVAGRAAEKAPKWWQRIAVKADQALGLGQTEQFIRECVLEAIRRYEES
jgi:hypothetical protein